MALSGYWLLDSLDIYDTYGAMIARGGYADLLKSPKRKPSLFNNWPEENGLEIDLDNPTFEEMEVSIPFYMVGDKPDFFANHKAFFDKIKGPGLMSLQVNPLEKTFMLYYKNTNNLSLFQGGARYVAAFTLVMGISDIIDTPAPVVGVGYMSIGTTFVIN
ncbi:MAG: hypothetical protein HC819_14815 [Cyclobacteriaceae bacterium]|nr:hypothetical protein [Cyclobacteriaceae bacterium]